MMFVLDFLSGWKRWCRWNLRHNQV